MEKRTSIGFVLGYIGGFINLLYALLAAYGLLAGLSDQQNGVAFAYPAAIIVILIIIPLTNFIGACICRNKPAAGRAFMYVTGLLLLILFINSLADLIITAPKQYPSGVPAYMITLYTVMIAAQALSVSAAALLSIPAGKEQAAEYGGMFELYEHDDIEETPQQEFLAVHRLYNIPVTPVSEQDQTAETKDDTE